MHTVFRILNLRLVHDNFPERFQGNRIPGFEDLHLEVLVGSPVIGVSDPLDHPRPPHDLDEVQVGTFGSWEATSGVVLTRESVLSICRLYTLVLLFPPVYTGGIGKR